jgi:Putative transposase
MGANWRRGSKAFFVAGLIELWENDELELDVDQETGEVLLHDINEAVVSLADPKVMSKFINQLEAMRWNVRIERPMACIEKVVEYLGRYVYRTAITNSRIKSVSEKGVSFEYNNYAATGMDKKAMLHLEGVEFLRRFAMHMLPPSFQRIRYYGLYATAAKATLLRAELAIGSKKPATPLRKVVEIVAAFVGHDPDECPICHRRNCWQVAEITPTNPRHCAHRTRRRTEPAEVPKVLRQRPPP